MCFLKLLKFFIALVSTGMRFQSLQALKEKAVPCEVDSGCRYIEVQGVLILGEIVMKIPWGFLADCFPEHSCCTESGHFSD